MPRLLTITYYDVKLNSKTSAVERFSQYLPRSHFASSHTTGQDEPRLTVAIPIESFRPSDAFTLSFFRQKLHDPMLELLDKNTKSHSIKQQIREQNVQNQAQKNSNRLI